MTRPDSSWLFVLAPLVADIGILSFSNFRVGLHDELLVLAASVFLSGLWFIYHRLRPVPRLASLARTALLFILYTNTTNILSYALTGALGYPLIDQHLATIDQAFGFNWLAWHHALLSTPALTFATVRIYHSLGLLLILLILLLDPIGRPHRARELFIGFAATSLPIVVIGALLPAAGAFVHYGMPEAHTTPYVLQFLSVHSGDLREIDLHKMQGIVQFPSFHAALAVICVYVVRGIAWLFWPILLLSILVVLVTPVAGGHYFVDVAGGLIMAGIVICLMVTHARHRQIADSIKAV